MISAGLAQFKERVWSDAVLQAQLLAFDDRATFITAVIETAQTLGYSFTTDEIEAAMRANQRAWAERWIL